MVLDIGVPTVNFHLWKPCNMRCGFCFASFQDIPREVLPAGHLGREESLRVVEALGRAGFRKLNFAGGEPTLCPWLPDLLACASALGVTTSVVTNGSRITRDWVKMVAGSLDWAALSVDSVNPDTLRRTGRQTRAGPMTEEDYLAAIALLMEYGVRVKINTVVTRDNLGEDLTGFIAAALPERWKLLQALPRRGPGTTTPSRGSRSPRRSLMPTSGGAGASRVLASQWCPSPMNSCAGATSWWTRRADSSTMPRAGTPMAGPSWKWGWRRP